MRKGSRAAVVALAVAAALSLVAAPGYATHDEVGAYTIGTTPVLSVVCSPDCLGEPGLNIGGYSFAGGDEVPVKVTIADSSNGRVSFTVCQDLNGALCGETGEPRVAGCDTAADLTTSAVAFQAGRNTNVFIRIADPLQPVGCTGVALGGTITLTYGAAPAV